MSGVDRDYTVVIPAYNSSATIASAVASAVAAGAARVIVVDDGSSDDTSERAQSAGAEVVMQRNQGASVARSRGARDVQTPFMTFLDADDLLVREGVQESLRMLRADSSVAAVGGRVIGFVDRREWLLPVNYSTITPDRLLITGYSAWPPAAAVMRVDALRRAEHVEPQPRRPRFAEDYELLIRLSLVGSIRRHNHVSMRYEMSGGKSLRSARASIDDKEDLRAYYAEFLSVPITSMSPLRRRAAANKRVAVAKWRSGQSARAMVMLALAYMQAAASLLAGKTRRSNRNQVQERNPVGDVEQRLKPTRRVFVWATGQDDNIGDSLLRRAYIDHIRGRGNATVWVREGTPGFVSGLGLSASDRVVASWTLWLWSAAWSAIRSPSVIAVNAGEMTVSYRGAVKLALLAPVLVLARLRGGHAVWLGAGVPKGGAVVPAFLYRLAARASDAVGWRDAESLSTMRVGTIQPDWAFALGEPVSNWRRADERQLLTVVLRGDRPRPDDRWWSWVADVAKAKNLTPTLIVQVQRDREHVEHAARVCGFDVVSWGSDEHRVQEALVRSYYSRSLVTVGDRLHGLIVAATEGSIPLGWVPSSRGKIGRHFATVGFSPAGEYEGESASQYPDVSTQNLLEWRRSIEDAVSEARSALELVTRAG
ncbi:MAG: glycosyl transferase family 2 [Microbacterium sp.]|jgi:glycosyltransferase involved in cell wall biosynthesis/polysaccharide pyruvyl transferase WcaK-like protein|nr:glycosyl transferase family 2 [Microbacterium sp.]